MCVFSAQKQRKTFGLGADGKNQTDNLLITESICDLTEEDDTLLPEVDPSVLFE